MSNEDFATGQTYENVFLIFVDSAGHSGIVAGNPRDHAGRTFDLLQARVVERLAAIAEDRGCQHARLWRWAGDGGFLAVHDHRESVARDVALQFAHDLLEIDLPVLRDEMHLLDIDGDLHLRIGVHRGTIRYLGVGMEGSIPSPDINFAAHLERAAPSDTVLISEDVYRVAGRHFAAMFQPVGEYEARAVYLYPGSARAGAGLRIWLATHGLGGAGTVFGYPERPHPMEKARLMNAAMSEVIHVGSALRSTARYLVTTDRPAYFRDATVEFLQRGGRCRCVLMDPDADATHLLSMQLGADLAAKIKESLTAFRLFKDRIGTAGDNLEVYQTRAGPTMGCLAVDLDDPHALILASPYLTTPPGFGRQIDGLSELPHYLVGRLTGRLFDRFSQLVRAFAEVDVKRVL